VEFGRGGRARRAALHEGRMPGGGDRRAGTRRLRHCLSAARTLLLPNRIPNEAYLTWFALILGRPLLGGQVSDTLRALEYVRSRPDVTAPFHCWATDHTA